MKVDLRTKAGHVLTFIADPSTTLSEQDISAMLPECVVITRSGFGTDTITESDVAIHALQVPFGAYLAVDGTLVAFSSASLLSTGALDTPVLYLGGTAISKEAQGAGFYWPMILTRFALGVEAGARHFTTRTQNPRVCKALTSFGPYPWTAGTEVLAPVAAEVAADLFTHASDFQRPGGLLFEPEVGVVRQAYEHPMYPETFWSGDSDIDKMFREHISVEGGDAVIVVGPIDPSACAARSLQTFDFDFDELRARIRPLLGDS